MAKGLEGRLLHMEHHHRGALAAGCRECRHWTHAVLEFDDREDPPPFCSTCGRSRPEEHHRTRYVGLNYEFDAPEVSHAIAH